MTFGERLKEARIRSRFTQEQLGERVGVEKMSISKYESEKMFPSSQTLIALSQALNVSPDYFFREIYVRLENYPEFRLDKRLGPFSKRDGKQIVVRTQDALNRYMEVLEIFQIDDTIRPDDSLRRIVRSYEEIEDLAWSIRKTWNIGSEPVGNMIALAERHGFKVIVVHGPPMFDAAVFSEEECGPVIVLRRGAPKDRQRFTLAHEIGHYFIRSGSVVYKSDDPERMANRFAAAFLMPRETFVVDVGRNRKKFLEGELCILREKYGVSVPALLVRMSSLHLISEGVQKKYQKMYDQGEIGVRPIGEAYTGTEKPFIIPNLVFRGVSEGILSEWKGRELLGEDYDEIMQCMKEA